MAASFVVFCSLFHVIYGQQYDGYDDGTMVLSQFSSLDSIFPQEHTLPLVHKLVNINTLNNAGNVTINDIKGVVDAMDTNIDSLNNAKNGKLVFNDIQKLSNSIHKSQHLLKNPGVVKLRDINAAKEKTIHMVKKIHKLFMKHLKLSGKELDFRDVLLSGGMGVLYSKVQDITKKDVQTSDPGAKQLQDVTSAKALSLAFKKMRAVVASGEKPSKKLSLKVPIRAEESVPDIAQESDDDIMEAPESQQFQSIEETEDVQPVSKHCKQNPYHHHCKLGGHSIKARDEDVMELKPAANKKLCLFNIHQEYCIHHDNS